MKTKCHYYAIFSKNKKEQDIYIIKQDIFIIIKNDKLKETNDTIQDIYRI